MASKLPRAMFVRWVGSCGAGEKSTMQHIMASKDEDVVSAGGAMGEWGGQLDSGKTGHWGHGAI